MTEETKDDVLETPEGTDAPEPTPQDPIEEAARAAGWLPKEEYEGDPAKWVSAEVFNARTPLFEKIEQLTRQIKNLDANNKAVVEHYNKVAKTEYDRALKDLKAQKRQALADGDLVAAEDIQDQIQEVQDHQKSSPPVTPIENTQVRPEFAAWVQKNNWYVHDPELRAVADGLGLRFSQEGKSFDEMLSLVGSHIRKVFPEKFRNPNKQTASAVEGKGSTSKTARSPSIEDGMSKEEKRIMYRVMETAGISKETYLKDYAAINGIKS